MADFEPAGQTTVEDRSEDTPLGDLFSRIVTDAKDLARAEVDLVRVRLVRRLSGLRVAVVLAVAAALLVIGALVVALVGILDILALYIGIIWATVATVLGTLAIAGILGRTAMTRFARIARLDEGSPS
jgi:hypothetical protein